MKANPDYKWHNPEKVAATTKPGNEGPKALKTDINITSDSLLKPGKLAGN